MASGVTVPLKAWSMMAPRAAPPPVEMNPMTDAAVPATDPIGSIASALAFGMSKACMVRTTAINTTNSHRGGAPLVSAATATNSPGRRHVGEQGAADRGPYPEPVDDPTVGEHGHTHDRGKRPEEDGEQLGPVEDIAQDEL